MKLSDLIVVLALLFAFSFELRSQNTNNSIDQLKYQKVYYSLDEALKQKDDVYILNIDITFPEQERYSSVPVEFKKFQKLRFISMRRHKLTEIDSNIHYCSGLQVLKLNGNQVEEIPIHLMKLKNLLLLDLSKNNLTHIPVEISKLENLTHLFLQNNKICEIPSSLYKMTHLQKINLLDNPIPNEQIEKLKKALPNTLFIEKEEEE